jgi:UDP-N-acetylmuramoylalanine--D-glutamate ligase
VYRRGVGTTEARVEEAEVVEGARAISVGLDAPGKSDVGLVQEILVDRAFLADRANQAWEISTLEELVEAGWALPDDVVVILTATAIARAFDVSPEAIAGVLSLP